MHVTTVIEVVGETRFIQGELPDMLGRSEVLCPTKWDEDDDRDEANGRPYSEPVVMNWRLEVGSTDDWQGECPVCDQDLTEWDFGRLDLAKATG